MFFIRIIAVLMLFNLISGEITWKNHTLCNVEVFFRQFFDGSQLNCIRIDTKNSSPELEVISKCTWNYFEEILKVPSNQTCETHIYIGANNSIFDESNFSPFTNILLINPAVQEDLNVQRMYLKSLNVFAVTMKSIENNLNVLPELYSLVGNKTFQWIFSKENYLNEKTFIQILLNNQFGIKELRIGFTDCPPFVITSGPVLDGIDIRLIKELTRNWKIFFFKESNWGKLKQSTVENKTDISICSIWIAAQNYHQLELTNFYDYQCETFIVRKPILLNKASYVYKPFQPIVWLTFLISIFLTGLVLKVITVFGDKLNKEYWSSSKFHSLTYSFMVMVNTVTSHGINKFPVQVPTKIVLTGWMLLSLIVGTHFSTAFTSFLSFPPTSKPIDTIQDFIDEEYIWSHNEIHQVVKEIKYCSYFSELMKLTVNSTEMTNNWFKEKKFGKVVKILSNKNYVGDAEDLASAGSLRVLKECLFKVYTSFGAQKNSGLTKTFDRKIRQ